MIGAQAMDAGAYARLAARELADGGSLDAGYKAALAAVQASPDGENWYLLGVALHKGHRWGAAVAAFRRAWAAGKQDSWTACNIGWNLHLDGEPSEAERWLRQAIELDPVAPLPWTNLAQALVAQGDGAAGVACAERALILAEEPHAAYHIGAAFARFATGDWRGGWDAYEARIRFKMPELLRYPIRRWAGEPVGRLFLLAEQGLGDTIMAWRWVAEAAARADRVIAYVQPELARLLATQAPANVEVHATPRALPEADAFCPLMSLPQALGLGRPAGGAYLEIPRKPRPNRVALAWAGSPTHDMDRWRSRSLRDLAGLLAVPGVDWVSVQVGPAASELEAGGWHGIVEAPVLSDFAATAEALASAALLVTVDTSVAHLGGALGIPTWIMLGARGVDWRWGLKGTRTPLYDSVRLWRASPAPEDLQAWLAGIEGEEP